MTDHPWDDPNLKVLYHVQLETSELIVSYEIATSEFDAIEIAKTDMSTRIPEGTPLWCGSVSSIGYVPIESLAILDMKVVAGELPMIGFNGEPVNVVTVERGPGGIFVGTDRVIVSKLTQ